MLQIHIYISIYQRLALKLICDEMIVTAVVCIVQKHFGVAGSISVSQGRFCTIILVEEALSLQHLVFKPESCFQANTNLKTRVQKATKCTEVKVKTLC